MKLIIESVIADTGEHYAYYGGYDEYTYVHKWAQHKSNAQYYTNGDDLFDALGRLFKDYSAGVLKFIIIKRK